MLWMAAAIAALGVFANLIRLAQRRGANMIWAGAVCYLTAAAACAVAWRLRAAASLGTPEALYGALSGLTILIGYFLFSACIRAAGVGVAQVFERLSMLVAVAVSALLWGNRPGAVQGVGLLLAVIAIPLVSADDTGNGAGHRRRLPMLLLLLAITGLGSVVLEAYRRIAASDTRLAFLVCQYLMIGGGILATAVWKRLAPRRADVGFGLLLGLANILFYFASLSAITPDRPGTVVFPTLAVGAILASAGGAALLWRERYGPRTLAGMGLAVAAILLVNWRAAAS